jgi:hypothetical protein
MTTGTPESDRRHAVRWLPIPAASIWDGLYATQGKETNFPKSPVPPRKEGPGPARQQSEMIGKLEIVSDQFMDEG